MGGSSAFNRTGDEVVKSGEGIGGIWTVEGDVGPGEYEHGTDEKGMMARHDRGIGGRCGGWWEEGQERSGTLGGG